jgi:hypothetical protein
MIARMVIGLGLTVVAFAVAGHRLCSLTRLARAGQPAPERVAYARKHFASDVKTQLTEVFGQRKLLKWSVPGAAHAATFWGFIILIFTIIEAYGDRRGDRRRSAARPLSKTPRTSRRGSRRPVPVMLVAMTGPTPFG